MYYKIISILFMALIFNACSIKEVPAMKVYTLSVPAVKASLNGRYRQKIIKISYPTALNEKLSNKINYSYSLLDRGEYLHSVWSNNLSKLLQGSIVQILMDSKLFSVVVSSKSNIKDDYRLESSIFDFSHHVRGGKSYAIMSIHCILINVDSGKFEKEKRFSYIVDTKTTDARGYVEATNVIMSKFAKDLVKWLEK